MNLQIKRFCIFGLHNKYDIDIPIADNKLILVGVNGLGKTTVVSILYFLLTEQWTRLFEFEFTSLLIVINRKEILISRSDLEDVDERREHYEKRIRNLTRYGYPPSLIRKISTHPMLPELVSARELSSQLIEMVAEDLGIGPSMLRRMITEGALGKEQYDLFTYPESIRTFLESLKASGNYQILYLPTYRRIEQDLKAIFPELEERQIREMTSRNSMLSSRSKNHVELVQFGMDDVETKIDTELKEISQSARSQLSNLTASYLRDIIRNIADSFDPELINSLDSAKIRAVLNRVEENTLEFKDKQELELAIERLRETPESVSERDKYLAHFFSRLLEIYNNLSLSEKNIQRLVDICNKYLEGKTLKYNDNDYTANVFDLQDSAINWKLLSSGEKQVASLFTHLILTKERSQFVLIDEPELSLSVPWQKTLLPDILNSGSCTLLVAVTHSPFIYANELDRYAIDLSRCIKASDTSRLSL